MPESEARGDALKVDCWCHWRGGGAGWGAGRGGILGAYTCHSFHNMITFAYQARDASGRIVTGIQDAINEDNAVTSLMSRGLMVLSLQKKADVSKSRKK